MKKKIRKKLVLFLWDTVNGLELQGSLSMLLHAHTCPCIFSLHEGYLMETAPFPGNNASKQTYRGDFMKGRRSSGKQNLRTTHFGPHLPVPCSIHIRGEPGRLELKKLNKHWRFCLLLFFPLHRWLPGLTRRIALPRMIAGRIQAICRPNCRGTRLSKQRSWPTEIVWTPSDQWEKRGFGQGWATGMRDSADSELQWSQTRVQESLSSQWHCPCCSWVYWEAYSFSPSRIFCVHLFLHSLSLLLPSVSLLCIFTVRAMETDGGLQ